MIKKYLHQKGYFMLKVENHPYITVNGCVPEHRIVMEKKIGRFINPLVEDVHHIDENVKNNNIKNLILLTKSEHRRYHSGWHLIKGEWWKTCNNCGKFMKVDGNFYKRNSGHSEYVTFCKDCCKKIGKTKKPYKDNQRVCEVCGKLFVTYRGRKPKYCSRECVWTIRKKGELNGRNQKKLSIVCCWCKKHLGWKDGKGTTGITHTICNTCKEKLLEEDENER